MGKRWEEVVGSRGLKVKGKTGDNEGGRGYGRKEEKDGRVRKGVIKGGANLYGMDALS